MTRPPVPVKPIAPPLHGAAVGAFVTALVLVWSISVRRPVDVDEHPFIATGALLARRALLPYRDYHYNHMPTQVLAYGLLFRTTSHLLLAARLFQAASAAALVAAVSGATVAAFGHVAPRRRLLLGAAAGALLLAHPLFTRTAGMAWNQDLPMLLAFTALLALRRAVRRAPAAAAGASAMRWAAAGGALFGASVTSRLTFAPLGAAMLLLIGLWPGITRLRRAALLVALGAGFALTCLPSIWVWAQSPGNAFFGNVLYPRLNTAYHAAAAATEHLDRNSAWPIARYALRTVLLPPVAGVVTVAFVACMAATLRVRRARRDPLDCELLALLVAVVCLTAGGFLPRPPWPQYFYPPVPFMILAIIACAAQRRQPRFALRGRALCVAAALAATCGLFSLTEYRGVLLLPRPGARVPLRAHAIGIEVAGACGRGKVLTLELIYPLEGGSDVYEQAATSRFGLRVARFLSPAERARYIMPTPDELDALYARDPPAGVLRVRGDDQSIERTLIRQAEAHGYRPIALPLGGVVWVPSGAARGRQSDTRSK